MQITEKTYNSLPNHLKALFWKLPNPGSDEVLAGFPDIHGAGAQRNSGEANQNGQGGVFGLGNHDGNGMRFGDSGSAARFFYCAKASKADREDGLEQIASRRRNFDKNTSKQITHRNPDTGATTYSDFTPSVRRNRHPTVKPTELMRYLCRLITPPHGTILDPFCGSGSTGRGAMLEGFNFIGIEMDAEYCEIAKLRIEAATPKQESLFG